MLNHHNPREGKGDFMRHPSGIDSSCQGAIGRRSRSIFHLRRYLRAVHCCHLRPVESFVLWDILERGWLVPFVDGSTQSLPVAASTIALAGVSAYHQGDIARSLASLRSRGIILPHPGVGYVLNRNYHEWMDRDGNPQIQARSLRYVETGEL
jgi:hypothetical protein